MSEMNELLARNIEFAGHVDLRMLRMPDSSQMPERLLLILTCVDPRVEPAGFLGLTTGDASVLRNAGGRVDQRVIEDIAYLAMRLGVRMDVAVIHHTQCGTGRLAEPAFRHAVAERTGLDEASLEAKAVVDPADTVRTDVEALRSSPLLGDEVVASVSGYVFRVETGIVESIAVASDKVVAALA